MDQYGSICRRGSTAYGCEKSLQFRGGRVGRVEVVSRVQIEWSEPMSNETFGYSAGLPSPRERLQRRKRHSLDY